MQSGGGSYLSVSRPQPAEGKKGFVRLSDERQIQEVMIDRRPPPLLQLTEVRGILEGGTDTGR